MVNHASFETYHIIHLLKLADKDLNLAYTAMYRDNDMLHYTFRINLDKTRCFIKALLS